MWAKQHLAIKCRELEFVYGAPTPHTAFLFRPPKATSYGRTKHKYKTLFCIPRNGKSLLTGAQNSKRGPFLFCIRPPQGGCFVRGGRIQNATHSFFACSMVGDENVSSKKKNKSRERVRICLCCTVRRQTAEYKNKTFLGVLFLCFVFPVRSGLNSTCLLSVRAVCCLHFWCTTFHFFNIQVN